MPLLAVCTDQIYYKDINKQAQILITTYRFTGFSQIAQQKAATHAEYGVNSQKKLIHPVLNPAFSRTPNAFAFRDITSPAIFES